MKVRQEGSMELEKEQRLCTGDDRGTSDILNGEMTRQDIRL